MRRPLLCALGLCAAASGFVPPIHSLHKLAGPAAVCGAARARAVSGRSSGTQLHMSSFSLDEDITMGVVDEQLKEAIEAPLKVLGPIADLIDTRENIFTFKYNGQIRNKIGIEAYARQMIKEAYPDTVDVRFLTNRVRDWRDD